MPPRQGEIDGHIAGRQEPRANCRLHAISLQGALCTSRSGKAERRAPERRNGTRACRQSGDGQAFEILIKRYQGRILAVAKRFAHIREDAEDIVQRASKTLSSTCTNSRRHLLSLRG